jgi:hypothetical protein
MPARLIAPPSAPAGMPAAAPTALATTALAPAALAASPGPRILTFGGPAPTRLGEAAAEPVPADAGEAPAEVLSEPAPKRRRFLFF